MLTKVAPGDEPGEQLVTSLALAGWDRTARLCAIKLTDAMPTIVPVVAWLILRR